MGILGVAGGVMVPSLALTGCHSSKVAEAKKTYAGSVYYTAENPGRWAKKVGGHLPKLTLG